MEFFLKARAWKLFVVMCVVPFGLQAALMSALAASDDPGLIFLFSPLLTISFIAIFIAWLWSLGTNLHAVAPETIRTNPRKFRLGLIYSSAYALIFEGFFTYAAKGNDPSGFFALIVPFHLLAMFFMFYAIYYIAKHLVMAEEKKDVTFYYFSGPFFLLWFFPIGIWFIQPRVNKLCS